MDKSAEKPKKEKTSSDCKCIIEKLSSDKIDFLLVSWKDQVAVKLRGLPWTITKEEICEFFGNYKIFKDSV